MVAFVKFSIEQEGTEIYSRFYSNAHILLHCSACTQVPQARLHIPLGIVLQVTSDIVAIKANKMAQTTGHEYKANSVLLHRINLPCHKSQFFKTFE
jgi:hypothetical protein